MITESNADHQELSESDYKVLAEYFELLAEIEKHVDSHEALAAQEAEKNLEDS